MADPPQYGLTINNPLFQGAHNVRATCRCGWEYIGERQLLRHAWNAHYRLEHSGADNSALLVDKQLQQSIFLPTAR